MKLSDFVAIYLTSYTDSIFLLSGGGIMHLVDSIGRSKLNLYCCHHEQAAAIAAEGYARMKNSIGVVVVTTGPGGTNAITGAAGAWLDSIPMLVICGQVKRDNIAPRKNGVPTVRAIGFQELNVIDVVKPISKYAATVEEPEDILYHLEKAIYCATTGRPGPSWVEIPLDVQAAEIKPNELKGFSLSALSKFKKPKIPIELIVEKLKNAKRPMMLVGNGVRLAGAEKILEKVLNKFKFNVATTIFTSDDLVTSEYSNYLGRQGIPGNKAANFAIDNCDVLLVIGERLQLTQTSYEYWDFATGAIKIMIDIDEGELFKKTIDIDIPVHCDAKLFLEELYKHDFKLKKWKVASDSINISDFQSEGFLNVYKFLVELYKYSKNYHVVTSDGMASLAPHQILQIKQGKRFLTNAGLGHMGSGLPMAIGASVASGQKVICMEGDGSLMLNIQELETMKHHGLPIKLFIYNNNGYFSIRNTHKNYFNKIVASDPESGVTIPDYSKLIPAWGLEYVRINNDKELETKLKRFMNISGPAVCELIIDPNQKMLPKWTAGQYRVER